MNLFNLIKKKEKVQTPVNSVNQPLDKLIDGELPFGWFHYYKDYIEPRENFMVSLAVKIQTTTGNDKIKALQELIDYFYEFKEDCQSKGECFTKYFDDMWMHCKNSRNDDFIYIAPYEDELERLK